MRFAYLWAAALMWLVETLLPIIYEERYLKEKTK